MEKQQVTITKGDKSGTIDELINFLNSAKKQGATHYKMDWSEDSTWSFKWFRTYRIKSDEEIKTEKINKLKEELKQLED